MLKMRCLIWKIEDTQDQMTSIIDFLLDLSVGQEIKFKEIHTKYQHAYSSSLFENMSVPNS